MKTVLKRLLPVLVVLMFGMILGRHWIAREMMISRMRAATGFPMEIGGLNIGMIHGVLAIRDMRISNPPEFADSQFMEIPEFHMEYKPLSMLGGQPHITNMTMVLDKIIIVRRADEDSNMDRMRVARSLSRTDCLVDNLSLRIGTVIFRNYDRDGNCLPESSIRVDATTTHKNLQGSSGIMWAMMKTIMLHGRRDKANSPGAPGASMFRKAVEKLSGISPPAPAVGMPRVPGKSD